MKKCFFILPILFWFSNTTAQQSFSIAEALSYATTNNVDYKNALLDLQIAEQKVAESVSSGLPKINGSLGFQNYIDIPITVIPANTFNPLASPNDFEELQFGTSINSTAGVRLDQLIFSASYIAGLKAAKVYKGLTEKVTQKALVDTKEKVIAAYYSCLIYDESKTHLVRSLENLKLIQSETAILVKEGMIEDINEDQINLITLSMSNQIAQLEIEAKNALSILKYIIGYPQDSLLALSENLSSFDNDLISLENFQVSVENLIDYQIVDQNRALSLLTLKMNKVASIPSVSGFFSHQQTALRNEFNLLSSDKPWYPSTFWGVNINIPIFTSGESHSITKQSELNLKKAENTLRAVKEGLKQQVHQASKEYSLALIALENNQENLSLSQKILKNTTTKFKEGVKSGLDLAQAQNQEISAQNKLAQSKFNLLLAKLTLDKLMNKL